MAAMEADTITLQVANIPVELRRRLKVLAAERGVPVYELIRDALEKLVDED